MKNICKNVCILLSACLLLLPTGFAGAAPKTAPQTIAGIPTVVHGNLVDLEAGEDALTDDSISPILAAIKAHPQARRIRLTWQRHMMNQVDDVRFVYDRSRQTLTVYSQNGGEDQPGNVGVVFSPVRGSTLAAILKAHPTGFHPGEERDSENIGVAHKNNADLWGGFQFLYLRRYGCRAVRLKHGADSVVWPRTNWPNS